MSTATTGTASTNQALANLGQQMQELADAMNNSDAVRLNGVKQITDTVVKEI